MTIANQRSSLSSTFPNNMLDTPNTDKLLSILPALKQDELTAVGLYFYTHSKIKTPLTREKAQKISDAGIYIVTIYENGLPTSGTYFTPEKAKYDAKTALQEKMDVGQPKHSAIYFAVDYDTPSKHLPSIEGYFTWLRSMMHNDIDYLGVYGNGLVCRRLTEIGLVSRTWLSGSKGWAGYADWKPHADIVQTSLDVSYNGLDVDFDSTNGNSGGWRI